MRANKNFLRLNLFKVQLKQELSSFIIKFKVNGYTQSTETISGKSVSIDKSYFFEIDGSSLEEAVEVSIISKKLFFESEVGRSSLNIVLSKQSEEAKAWYSITDMMSEEIVMQVLLSFSSDNKSKQKLLSSNYNTESTKPRTNSKADLSYDRIFVNSQKKASGLLDIKILKTTNIGYQDHNASQDCTKGRNEGQNSVIEHQDSRELASKQLSKTNSASQNAEQDETANVRVRSNKSIILQNSSLDETDYNQRSLMINSGDFDQSRVQFNDFGNLSALFNTSLLPASDNFNMNATSANISSNSLLINNSILNNTLIPSYGVEIMKKLKKKYTQIMQEKDILSKVSSDVSKNKEMIRQKELVLIKEKEAIDTAAICINKISNLQNQEIFKLNSLKKQYDYEKKMLDLDKELHEYEGFLLSNLIQKTKQQKKAYRQGETGSSKGCLKLEYSNNHDHTNNVFRLEYHKEFDYLPQHTISLPSSTKNRKAIVDKRVSLSQDKDIKNMHYDNASTAVCSMSISRAGPTNTLFSVSHQANDVSLKNAACNQSEFNRFQAGIKNINVSIINNTSLIPQSVAPHNLANSQQIKQAIAKAVEVSNPINIKKTANSKPAQINLLPDTKSMSSGKFQNKTIMLESVNVKSKKSPPDVSSPKNAGNGGKGDNLTKIINSSLLLRANQNTNSQTATGQLSLNTIHNNRFEDTTIKPNPSNANINFNSKTKGHGTKPMLTIPSKQKDSSKDIIIISSSGKEKPSENTKAVKQNQTSIKDASSKGAKKANNAYSQILSYVNTKAGK